MPADGPAVLIAGVWPIAAGSLTCGVQSVDNLGVMTRSGKRCVSPATLVALSLLVSAGAMAEVSSTTMLTGPMSNRLARTESQREQVAQLLACLTQAAKELHGRGSDRDLPAADASWLRSPVPALDLSSSRLGMADAGDDRRPTATPWPAHLIDLPPPAVSSI